MCLRRERERERDTQRETHRESKSDEADEEEEEEEELTSQRGVSRKSWQKVNKNQKPGEPWQSMRGFLLGPRFGSAPIFWNQRWISKKTKTLVKAPSTNNPSR